MPGWRDVSLGLPDVVSSVVQAWLLHDGSVTERLSETFSDEVEVNVLHDASGLLLNDECELLNTKDTEGHVREVTLWCGGEPVVIARTVYTSPILRTHHSLASLGSRPLGKILFAYGSPRRLKREFAMLDENISLLNIVRRAPFCMCSSGWARRTLFLFEHEHLLVTEIFLPAVLSQP